MNVFVSKTLYVVTLGIIYKSTEVWNNMVSVVADITAFELIILPLESNSNTMLPGLTPPKFCEESYKEVAVKVTFGGLIFPSMLYCFIPDKMFSIPVYV